MYSLFKKKSATPIKSHNPLSSSQLKVIPGTCWTKKDLYLLADVQGKVPPGPPQEGLGWLLEWSRTREREWPRPLSRTIGHKVQVDIDTQRSEESPWPLLEWGHTGSCNECSPSAWPALQWVLYVHRPTYSYFLGLLICNWNRHSWGLAESLHYFLGA